MTTERGAPRIDRRRRPGLPGGARRARQARGLRRHERRQPEAGPRGDRGEPPDILLVDLHLPDGSGLDLLEGFEPASAPEVVLITGSASVETAVEALRRGVADYLTKPVDLARVKMVLGNVTRTLELRGEIGTLRGELRKLGRFGPLIGASPPMQKVYDLIGRVAPPTPAS